MLNSVARNCVTYKYYQKSKDKKLFYVHLSETRIRLHPLFIDSHYFTLSNFVFEKWKVFRKWFQLTFLWSICKETFLKTFLIHLFCKWFPATFFHLYYFFVFRFFQIKNGFCEVKIKRKIEDNWEEFLEEFWIWPLSPK